MPFRIKDLTVDLTATNLYPCRLHTIIFCQAHCSYYFPSYCHCTIIYSYCPYHTYIVACQAATQPIVGCPGGSAVDPFDTNIVVQPPELLKARLQEALKAVEAQERVVQESQQVQTVAEAELLEKKLTEALEEIRARRAHLQKGGK